MSLNELRLENPLWSFALKVYPVIQEELLALQAQGVRINYALLALWLAQQCMALTRRSPDADRWFAEYTAPLRQLRYGLRALHPENTALSESYNSLKAAELELERVELALLYKEFEAEQMSAQPGDLSQSLCRANLVWVLAPHLGDAADGEAERLLEKLSQWEQ